MYLSFSLALSVYIWELSQPWVWSCNEMMTAECGISLILLFQYYTALLYDFYQRSQFNSKLLVLFFCLILPQLRPKTLSNFHSIWNYDTLNKGQDYRICNYLRILFHFLFMMVVVYFKKEIPFYNIAYIEYRLVLNWRFLSEIPCKLCAPFTQSGLSAVTNSILLRRCSMGGGRKGTKTKIFNLKNSHLVANKNVRIPFAD